MLATRSISLTFTLLVCLHYLLRETEASFSMSHPQKLFCDADYVFRFRAMAEPKQPQSAPGINRVGRLKRLAPGGMGVPMKQMVEVERIYKGEKMVMPMMQMAPPPDSFSNDRKMEANIQLDMSQKAFKQDDVHFFFGKMYRYRNKTMMPSSKQIMMCNTANTIAESSVTKVMNRGFRKKYAQGCKSGCQVRTVFQATTAPSKQYCYWDVTAYRAPKTDCCKTAQFCYRSKTGYCVWKKTRAYKNCLAKNRSRMP